MKRIEERINRELREQLTTINTKAISKSELKTIVRNTSLKSCHLICVILKLDCTQEEKNLVFTRTVFL